MEEEEDRRKKDGGKRAPANIIILYKNILKYYYYMYERDKDFPISSEVLWEKGGQITRCQDSEKGHRTWQSSLCSPR